MGCDTYNIKGFRYGGWRDIALKFADSKEDIPCVCTFPLNYEEEKKLDGEIVISLALLGVAVKLAHGGTLGDEAFIPECIPDWILQQIKAHIITQEG